MRRPRSLLEGGEAHECEGETGGLGITRSHGRRPLRRFLRRTLRRTREPPQRLLDATSQDWRRHNLVRRDQAEERLLLPRLALATPVAGRGTRMRPPGGISSATLSAAASPGLQLITTGDQRELTKAIPALLPGASWQETRRDRLRGLPHRAPAPDLGKRPAGPLDRKIRGRPRQPEGLTNPLLLCCRKSGGPQGSRTPDLRRAKAALSQLS